MEDRILLKFLRNEASEPEIRQVLEWVETSPENRHYLDSLDLVDSALLFWGPRLKAQGFDAAVSKTFDIHTDPKAVLHLCTKQVILGKQAKIGKK